MKPGSEGHPRIQSNAEIARLWRVPPPGRNNHQALADSVNEEVLLPGLGPVRLLEHVDPQRLDPSESAEMPDRLVKLLLALSGPLVLRQVGFDQNGPAGINADQLTVGRANDRFFDRDALPNSA